jgi:hypothetical protein
MPMMGVCVRITVLNLGTKIAKRTAGAILQYPIVKDGYLGIAAMPDVRHLSVWHGPTEVLRDDSLPAPGGDGGRARGNGAGKMNPF